MTHAGAKFYIQSEIINLNLIALKKAALGKNVPIKKVQLMNKKIIMPQCVTKQPSDIFLMLFLFSFLMKVLLLKT